MDWNIKNTDVSNSFHIRNVVENSLLQCRATILGYQEHVFPNQAITFCFLLSESHCTVHTYPEYDSMWIDCFTCGESFDMTLFKKLIRDGLHVGLMEDDLIHRK